MADGVDVRGDLELCDSATVIRVCVTITQFGLLSRVSCYCLEITAFTDWKWGVRSEGSEQELLVTSRSLIDA